LIVTAILTTARAPALAARTGVGAAPSSAIAALERGHARHRADPQRPVRHAQVAELGNPVEVDNQCRPGKPEVHHRHEALTAGERDSAWAVQQLERALERPRSLVRERRRLHAQAPSATTRQITAALATASRR
jgi:hypothetical protein